MALIDLLYFPIEDLENIYSRVNFKKIQGENLLLTGGTGFIGRWILESILYANEKSLEQINLYILSRDPEAFLKNYPNYNSFKTVNFIQGNVEENVTLECKVKYIIHAAAESESRMNKNFAFDSINTIAYGTKNILDFAVKNKIKNLLYISSGAVYGNNTTSKIDELYSGSPLIETKNAYGESKRFAELLCKVYSDKFNLNVAIMRCFAFVGPGLPLDKNFAIGNFIKNCLNKEFISIKSDGTAIRSYMYAGDLTVWLLEALVNSSGCEVFNVGSDQEISIKCLAEKIASISNNKLGLRIEGVSDNSKNPDHYVPLTDKIKTNFSLELMYSLDESIKKTLGYYKDTK